jgi:Ca2+-transporting ATPase
MLMTTVHKFPSVFRQITKGAPDILISCCDRVLVGNAQMPLSQAKRMQLMAKNDEMAAKGLRVIATAYRDIYSANMAKESALIFCGLIGMSDPPRPEVESAVSICKQAGITPVMITGDHIVTANTIASKLGILEEGGISLTGHKLDNMSEKELAEKIRDCRVFARVTPEHKVRIVKAFRENNDIVAMTGDGVNDAPALKAADIGCAMGKCGTDVAKGAADMILTDDNFPTIVNAVAQGRAIYENNKKAVHFQLSCNIGEILVIFIASVLGMPSPLLPIQLLWVNLVTDSLPAIALGFERIDSDIMKRKPISAKQSFFASGLGYDIGIEGFMVGAITLLAFVLGCNVFDEASSLALGRTMAFATLSFSELVHAQNMRSSRSVFSIGLFSNKRMVFSTIICAFMQIIVLVITPLAALFKVVAMEPIHWITVAGLSLVPLIVLENEKMFRK